jgi:hypothetical protein
MATTRPHIPGTPGSPGYDARHRSKRLPALLRSGRGRWSLGLVLVLAAAAVTVALLPNGDYSGLADPVRSAAAWLDSHPGSPSASPVSPSAPGSPSPSAKASSPSAAPSRSPKSSTPGRIAIIDPGRANCAPKPSACGLPDATNTGVPAGTALSVVNDNVTVTKAGTVIDRKDIRGCVRVQAPGVTIRRSKITCPDFYVIASFRDEYSGNGLVVEDSEISCGDTRGTALGDNNVTARRLNIHSCENGFDIDASFTVQDSYIHDLFQGEEAHTDGIQLAGGARITINHNTIFDNSGTSAIISHPNANSDVVVANNLMAGGAYTLYCPRDTSRNFRVVGNRISTLFYPTGGDFGPWTDCDKVAELRGNIWDNNLKPVVD